MDLNLRADVARVVRRRGDDPTARGHVEGVVTVYDHPYSPTDHEAVSANIPVFGVVKGGRVVVAHPEDIAGDKAVRIKPKS